MDKKNLKERCVNLYLKGTSYIDIAKKEGFSRKYITDLIKNDPRIIEMKNNKKVKVYKRKDNNQMVIYIPNDFIKKIGISENKDKIEYVNIVLNKDDKSIIITRA